jgi:hypothetical protein
MKIRKGKKIICTSLLAMIVVLMSISAAAAVAWEGFLIPQNSAGSYGEDTPVELRVTYNDTGLPYGALAYQVDIHFDPGCVNITAANFAASPFGSHMFTPYAPGVIRILEDNFNTMTPISSGTFKMAELTFHGKCTGSCSCNIWFDTNFVSDTDGEPITNSYTNGTYTCTGAPYLVTYTISNRTIAPLQMTEIDVDFSEKVSYHIAIEKDTATIYDWTGTAKNPDPKVWNGTYEANGLVVPDGDYTVNVTGTNTTTGLSVINNTEIIKVTGAKLPGVKIQVLGIPVIGINTSDILKVEYTNFSYGDAYNVSITFNGTQVYYESGNLTGTSPEIIPINWTASSTGNHTILAWGSGMVDSTPVHIYDSTVVAPIPELATIILTGAGMIGLIGIRRWYGK